MNRIEGKEEKKSRQKVNWIEEGKDELRGRKEGEKRKRKSKQVRVNRSNGK